MREYKKAVEYIKEMISSGELSIGDKLPAEREIAETLNISRNSTREAMRILDNSGVITSKRGSGNYLAGDIDRGFASVIDTMLILHKIDKTEIGSFRRYMDKLACNMILHKENADTDAIGAAVKDTWGAEKEDRAVLDKNFHYQLIKATDNRLVMIIMNCIAEIYSSWIQDIVQGLPEEQLQECNNCHMKIYEGLVNNDLKKCYDAIDEHYDLTDKYWQK